ncbi:MAG: hypothetical protein RL748_1231, partial [Pseudomonadota bacterium]
AGEFEKVKKGDPRFNQTEDLVADALRFEKILQSRRYPSLQVKSEMIPNEDHLTVAPITATRGVMWAFAKK